MARDRQDAKQRQAERRAKRLAQQGKSPDGDGQKRRQPPVDEPLEIDDPTTVEPSPAVPPELAVGAPPTDEGRSDRVFHSEPTIRDEEPRRARPGHVRAGGAGRRSRTGRSARTRQTGGGGVRAERQTRRPSRQTTASARVSYSSSIAVWAELQRVQWPDRQALTTLTGVVLGFVLIAGGYLGLLDAIVSRIVNAIL